jgi:hypothetical protein
MNICDAAVHPEPDEEYPCGQSSVTYSVPIHVTADSRVFILPFSGFEISEWQLNSDPPVTMTPQFYGVTEISFNPDDEAGVLEIQEVSSVTQTIPVQVKGPKINDYYFQHSAYVMQGVDDLDSIYALPLEGIPELGTGYVAIDSDSDELSWVVVTSDPAIGAGFQDDTLYIWGADASWSGYGSVTLSASDETGASDSIEIPVTVFRKDKTLVNPEGKEDYFVPWSPSFAAEDFVRGIHVGVNTYNWHESVEMLPEDYFEYILSLNAGWVGLSICLHVHDSLDSTVSPSTDLLGAETYSDEDLARIVHELKSRGLRVYWTLAFDEHRDGEPGKQVRRDHFGNPTAYETGFESWRIRKEYWPWDPDFKGHDEFVAQLFETYTSQAVHYASLAEDLGVDMFSLGTETKWLFRTPDEPEMASGAYAAELRRMVAEVRKVYGGVLTYDQNGSAPLYGPEGSLDVWGDLGLDAIGLSAYFALTGANPLGMPHSVDDLQGAWARIFRDYLIPLKERNPGLPLYFLEFGCTDKPGGASAPVDSTKPPRVFVDRNHDGLDDGEEEQANYYEALFRTVQEYPGVLNGVFSWSEPIAPESMYLSNVYCVRATGVRGKLSERVLREEFSLLRGGSETHPKARIENPEPMISNDRVVEILHVDESTPVQVSCGGVADGETVPADSLGMDVDLRLEVLQSGEELVFAIDGAANLTEDTAFSIKITSVTGPECEIAVRPKEGCLELRRLSSGTAYSWSYACDRSLWWDGNKLLASVPIASLSEVMGSNLFGQSSIELSELEDTCDCAIRYTYAVDGPFSLWGSETDAELLSLPLARELKGQRFGLKFDLADAPDWVSRGGHVIEPHESYHSDQPGLHPSSMEVSLDGQALEVAIQLEESDTFGSDRNYAVHIDTSLGPLFVRLDPSLSSAWLELRNASYGKQLSRTLVEPLVYFDSNYASAVIPIAELESLIAPAKVDLLSAALWITIHADNTYEVWSFTGSHT